MTPTTTSPRQAKLLSFLWLCAAILVTAGSLGCDREKEPIKLGFSGCLTGRLSDLGTSGRNGVILAVEQVNEAGGINGRPVELIVRDDGQDTEEALRVDQELIDRGVAAIIGHMTSAISMAAVPLINEEQVLMISPTTSTNALKGIDDYFIRVMPPNSAETEHLARYAYQEAGARKIAAVVSLVNRAYTEGFLADFTRVFQGLGGKVISVEPFPSGSQTDFVKLTQSLLKPDPDAVLLVAGSLDAAMICQHIRMSGTKIPIFSCGWAMTDALIEHGGAAVEGVVFSQLFDRKSGEKNYLLFTRRFEDRFGEAPDFAACHAYEAARVILQALSVNPDPDALKATILGQGTFDGLQGDLRIDPYGDPRRRRYLIKIKGGQFRSQTTPE